MIWSSQAYCRVVEVMKISGISILAFAGFIASGMALGAADTVCVEPNQELDVLERSPPAYPVHAQKYCIEGQVDFEAVVGPDGRLHSVRITESHPDDVFDEVTLEAAGKWRFSPRCRNGDPVDREITQSFMFEMDNAGSGICPTELEGQARLLYSKIINLRAEASMAVLDAVENAEPADTLEVVPSMLEGDWALLEQFHRNWINQDIEQHNRTWEQIEVIGYDDLWNYQRLVDDGNLEVSRGILRDARELVHRAELEGLQILERQIQGLNELSVSDEARQYFVDPLVAGTDDLISAHSDDWASAREPLAHHQNALEILIDNEGFWEVVDGGELRFNEESVADHFWSEKQAAQEARSRRSQEFLDTLVAVLQQI